MILSVLIKQTKQTIDPVVCLNYFWLFSMTNCFSNTMFIIQYFTKWSKCGDNFAAF